MGIDIKIKEIIIEIEYILIITLLTTTVSKTAMSYLDKYYVCLLFVIFHELAHVLLGTVLGKKLKKVFIGISGMTAFFKYEYIIKTRKNYIIDLLVFLAGPVANIVIATIFCNNKFIYEINMFLAILNFLPIFPLDGYNIIKSIGISLFIQKKRVVIGVVNCISVVFISILSVICITIFLMYRNISSIIFLIYLLLLNVKNNNKLA